jgi:type I restriction enzyme S subunit
METKMPNNWKKYTLNDISRIGDGAHAKVERKENGILYLTSKNFKEGKLVLDKVDFISEEDYEKLFSVNSKAIRRPQTDDIILGIIGTIGNAYCYKASDKFGISSSVALIRPDNEMVLSKYLYYYIISNTFKHYQNSHNGASVQGYTNIPSLKSIPIELPPLPEQQAIAEILSSLDDKIELNLKTNKTLEEIANVLYKHWFVDFGPFKTGKFIESELGMIPEGWEVKKIGQIGLDISDGNYSSKYPTNDEFVDTGIPFIRAVNMKNGSLIRNDLRYITKEKHSQITKGHLKRGDVLLVTRGMIGDLARVPDYFINANINAQLVRLNGNNILPSPYLYLTLSSEQISSTIKANTSGTALQQLPIGSLNSIFLTVPTKDILSSFNIQTEILFEKIDINNDENHELKQTRDYLLPKLISGEIQVKQAAKLAKQFL